MKSEKKYRLLFENSKDAVFITSPDGRYLDINPAGVEMFGYASREEMLRLNIEQDIYADPAERKRFQQRLEETGYVKDFRLELRRKNGEKLIVLSTATAVRDEKGDVVEYQGITHDITLQERENEALLEEMERLDLALKSADMGIWSWDIAARKIFFDEQSMRLLGLDPSTFTGDVDEYYEIVHPEDRALVRSSLYDSLKDKGLNLFKDEYRILPPGGGTRYITGRWKVIRDSHGRPSKLHGIQWDVTDRKRAEDTLKETNELLRVIIDTAPTAIVGLDLEGKVRMVWNRAAEKMLGWSAEEAMGRFLPSVPVENKEEFRRFRERIRAGKTLDGVEVRRQRSDGTDIDYTIYASPLRDRNGAVFGNIAVMVDITERKRSEEKLREREELYRRLVETSPDGIALFDLTGKVQMCNRQFADLLGYGSVEDIIGLNAFEFGDPEERDRIANYMRAAIEKGRGDDSQFHCRKKDGTPFIAETRASLISDSDGRPAAIMCVTKDITRRKEAELELQRSRDMLKTFLDNSYDAVFIHDSEGKVLDVNATLLDMYRVTREEALKLSIPDYSGPDNDFDGVRERWKKVLSGTDQFFTWQARRPVDGSLFDVEVYLTRISMEGRAIILANVRDVTERRQAENERFANIHFLESLDRINRVLQEASDLQQMMGDALDAVLSIFGCDRAFLAVPLDPDAPEFRISMERTNPAFPGAFARGVPVPITQAVKTHFRKILSNPDVDEIYIGNGIDPEDEVNKSYGIKSQLVIALYPKVGKPWELGVHQCSYARKWTLQEKKLFQEISRRLADGLTALLANRDLQQNREFLDNVVENLPAMVFVKDAETLKFVSLNKAGEQLLGYSREELLGKGDRDFFPKKEADFFADKDREALATKELVEIQEETIRNRKGEKRILHTRKIPITDEAGKPKFLLGISEDVTVRRKTEEALRKSETWIRSIFQALPIGMHMYRLEEDGRLVLTGANPAADKILGISHVDLIGKTLEEAFPGLEETEVPQRYRTAASQGETWYAEQVNYREGTIRGVYEVYAFQTSPENMAAAFEDITERRRMEESLRKSEERLKRLLLNANDIICLYDENWETSLVGGPIDRVLGYNPEEFRKKPVVELIHPEDADKNRKGHAETVGTPGSSNTREFRMLHKNGKWVTMEAVETNLTHDPLVKSFVMSIRDVSERHRLQEQLQQAMKMEAIGRLAGGIAHDFNNLLTVLSGNLELAKLTLAPSNPLNRFLDQMAKATESATSLTRQLLSFSRKQIIEPKVLNLNELVRNIRHMLGRLLGETVRLKTVLCSDLGSVRIDPGQFEQVLVNLSVNARDAMPDGGTLVIETANVVLDQFYCATHPYVRPGDFVMLAVSDTGHGMSDTVKEHLFEPFFTTKGKSHGTGLGLATIFGVVKQAGGSIEVYSEVDRGTTFKIYLPSIEQAAEKLGRDKASLDHPKGGETILLVEDENSVRLVGSSILKKLGYQVIEACSGEEALMVAERHSGRIDLLMTDIVMPGMNGRELSERLTRLRPSMKTLFASGYTENIIVHHGILESKIHFIGKPYNLQSLTAKIREVLGEGKSPRS